MEVSDDFWHNLPKVTMRKKIVTYILRILLLPIYIVLLLWGIIDYNVSMRIAGSNTNKREKYRLKLVKRHVLLAILQYLYSHEYLYGY
jgi:hypothetical protein